MVDSNIRDVVLTSNQQDEQTLEPKVLLMKGILVGVDYADSADVMGRTGYSWVREMTVNGHIFQCLNPYARSIPGVPVIIYKSTRPPYRHVIQGVDYTYLESKIFEYGANAALYSLQNHASTHEQRDGISVVDGIDVYPKALVPFRVEPTNPPSLSVRINAAHYVRDGSFLEFPATTLSLSSYIPATEFHYVKVLLDFDYKTGTLGVTSGPAVVGDYAVDPVVTKLDVFQLASVKLFNGMMSIPELCITEDNRTIFNFSVASSTSLMNALGLIEAEQDYDLTMHMLGGLL